MKKLIWGLTTLCVLILCMVSTCHAATGPLYEIWTHSIVPWECAVKTAFWWIGGWMMAIRFYDKYMRAVPTTRADVIQHWRERPRREP